MTPDVLIAAALGLTFSEWSALSDKDQDALRAYVAWRAVR